MAGSMIHAGRRESIAVSRIKHLGMDTLRECLAFLDLSKIGGIPRRYVEDFEQSQKAQLGESCFGRNLGLVWKQLAVLASQLWEPRAALPSQNPQNSLLFLRFCSIRPARSSSNLSAISGNLFPDKPLLSCIDSQSDSSGGSGGSFTRESAANTHSWVWTFHLTRPSSRQEMGLGMESQWGWESASIEKRHPNDAATRESRGTLGCRRCRAP